MKFDEQLSLSCIISEVKRDIIMFGTRKATMVDLQDDEKSLRICSLVSIQFTNVTDRRTGISRRHRSEKVLFFDKYLVDLAYLIIDTAAYVMKDTI